MVYKHEKGSGSMAKRLLGLCLALVMLCGVFVPTFASVAGVDGESQPQQEQTAEPTGGTDGKQDTEGQPTGGAEDVNAGDDGEKKDDTGNVSGDARDESENAGSSTGDTGDGKDANTGDAKGDVKDESGESKDDTKDANADDAKAADADAVEPVAEAANGIATYATVNPVPADSIADNTNIKVNMFNYTGKINNDDGDREPVLYFHNGANQNAVDDNTLEVKKQGTRWEDSKPTYYLYEKTGNVLGADGYPTYHGESLKYLFDTSIASNDSIGFTHYTAAKNSGLFKAVGNGYLEYDSAENAAYFNTKTGTFTLYDGVVRPAYTQDKLNAIRKGNFLPFNSSSQFEVAQGAKDGDKEYQLEAGAVDLWFGMTVEFEFLMPENGLVSNQPMQFEFKGDDDVWVFIDDVLVLDIGGTHGAQIGTINFATGACNSPGLQNTNLKQLFTDALGANNINEADWKGNTFANFSTHTLKFFYLERGGNISYCKLRFNMPTLPSKSLIIGKELTTDANGDLEEHLKQTYTYKFRVLKEDDPTKLYVPEGTKYTLVDKNKNYDPVLDANSKPVEGEVDSEGYITLKAGQYARFTDMSKHGESGKYTYIVEETLPSDLTGQYGSVQYKLSGDTGTTITGKDLQNEFTGYRTDTLSAMKSQIVRYNNVVATQKMGQLTIEKKVEGTGAPNDDFIMKVKLGDELLPVPQGTPYTVIKADGTTESKTVTGTDGKITLKAGEKATFDKILAGTKYQVTEVNQTIDNTSYKFECEKVEASQVIKDGEKKGQSVGTATVDANKVASGTVGVNGAVSIVVTNKYTPKTTDVTVKKIVAGLLGDTSKNFIFSYSFTGSDGTTQTGTLTMKHGESKTIQNVPIGATVTVTETDNAGYTTTWVNGLDERGDTTTATLVAGSEVSKNTITFTNHKDANPDTGIFLDSMPYIMALVIVAGGAAVFFLRRRKKSED